MQDILITQSCPVFFLLHLLVQWKLKEGELRQGAQGLPEVRVRCPAVLFPHPSPGFPQHNGPTLSKWRHKPNTEKSLRFAEVPHRLAIVDPITLVGCSAIPAETNNHKTDIHKTHLTVPLLTHACHFLWQGRDMNPGFLSFILVLFLQNQSFVYFLLLAWLVLHPVAHIHTIVRVNSEETYI